MKTTLSSVRTYKSSYNPEEPEKPTKLPRQPKKFKPAKWLPWFVVVLLIGVSIFLFFQYRQAQTKLLNAAKPNVESSNLVTEVGRIIILPTGETPTIITVAKADKLKDQSFFANAVDGDKVIVYTSKKKAILYRPSTKQIVNVESVSISNNDSPTITR